MSEPVPETKTIIRTTTSGWLKQLAEAYKNKTPFVLEDDAKMGIDPREDSLLGMGLKAKLSRREWSAVLVSVGIAGVGVWLVIMAVLDPEPYSKVASTIAAGAVLLGTGGLVAIRILTHIKPPNIRISKTGVFEIFWS
jgi:hypothetical protein